jgi:hypothetical protein
VGRVAIYACGIVDMMMTRQRGSRLDEVTEVPARRPALLPGASEAVRRGLEELGSTFLIPTTPAARQSTNTLLGDAPIAAFAGAFLGCVTTECLSVSGTMPCIASAWVTAILCGLLLVTRTASLFAGAFFPALYGGTFAGMTPVVWLSDGATVAALSIALSIVCGLVFFVVTKLDNRSAAPIGIGCGGRLGAIAVVASFLFVELVRSLGADVSRFHTVAADAFDVEPGSAIRAFLACLAGIVATLFALRQRRMAGGGIPVRIFIASAAALVGLIVLHAGNPDDAGAMEAFYAGCFLGMSTLDRLKGWFQPVSGAVVLVVLLVPVRAFLNGFGGGLGLAAFIAVMLLIALSRATVWMTRDPLTGSRNLARAIAGAIIVVCLIIGLISAEYPARQAPISVDTAALASTAESPDPTPVRLVVGNPAPGAADNPIPINISLINAAADDVVILSGLPSGSTMTNGRPSATGGWQLLARELADAVIRPAQGFVGGADVTVELRRADQSIVDRQGLHLEWAGPAPPATTDVAAPLAAGPLPAQSPDELTEDEQALFREFLQSKGHAAPETRGVAHPVRTVAHGQQARSPAVTSTGPHVSLLPSAGAEVRPLHPLAARGDISDRQKKPAPKNSQPATRGDRPTTVSAVP